MNPPSGAEPPESSSPAAPPLGPAVSRRVGASPRAEGAAGPLPPFVPPPSAPPKAPAPTVHAAGTDSETDAVLGAVAERLERVAAGLRRGSLAELLARVEAEDADSLEVLITGYALGYAEAARRSR